MVQVNGKMRDTVQVKNEKLKVKSEIEKKAKESQKVDKYLHGKVVKQIIYVPGKVINFVVA